jgi:hypothetical protein
MRKLFAITFCLLIAELAFSAHLLTENEGANVNSNSAINRHPTIDASVKSEKKNESKGLHEPK